ncbi:YciI family protein [Clostridium massiliamazoniense]|uniref:YciI family protein n=1 Tax=Clostridium massiliamazoniense TaxID=1347366 RepID=UPI0006D7C925|nr:YciI family protein [Clostridium massiliamazoniense]
MKYFIVEGTIKNQHKVDDKLMKVHMDYTQKAMNKGLILMSGLKEDMSGGIFVMKSESLEILEDYLNNEPFKLAGVQDYKVTEFSAHYFNENPKEWFNK